MHFNFLLTPRGGEKKERRRGGERKAEKEGGFEWYKN